MSNMSIAVEFLCGTDIKEAILEARTKAKQWDVAYVTFKFNGISFSVSQRADVDYLASKFHEAFDKEIKHIVG